MLDKLLTLCQTELEGLLTQPEIWSGLLINRRKPETVRLWTPYEDGRLCLHRFSPCDDSEALAHPHPWPAAFMVLAGAYRLHLGIGSAMPHQLILARGGAYEIITPSAWHSVAPLCETWTVMLNGADYAAPDKAVRRTAGKGLETLTDARKRIELDVICDIIGGG